MAVFASPGHSAISTAGSDPTAEGKRLSELSPNTHKPNPANTTGVFTVCFEHFSAGLYTIETRVYFLEFTIEFIYKRLEFLGITGMGGRGGGESNTLP